MNYQKIRDIINFVSNFIKENKDKNLLNKWLSKENKIKLDKTIKKTYKENISKKTEKYMEIDNLSSSFKKISLENNLIERINWAIKKPDKIVKIDGKSMKKLKEEKEKEEKEWGNSMINAKNNGQWTTLLGENLVYEILKLKGENPKKVISKGGFKPDWETDNYIYEVKTSNWWVSGTAGEKVLGTWIKYQNIPELYNKPLRIVCIANQEHELEHGKVKYFGENITEKTKEILNLAKSWGIEYIKFSDMVKDLI